MLLVSEADQKKEPVKIPILRYFDTAQRSKAKNADRSTTTAALLSFALVLLDRSLVMAEALEIRKNPGLGDLTLKATQSRFDAFVFSNRDLSHSKSEDFQLSNVASDRQMAQRAPGDPGMPSR